MKKKILSFLLALVLILSYVPVPHAYAAETTEGTPTISVESKYAAANSQVEVNVNISENPGIAGAKITATFSDKLTLTDAVVGSTFASLDYTEPASLTSGCAFNWDSLDAVVTEDGILLTLIFTVSADASANEELDVSISYRSGDIYNGDLENVEFEIVNGSITIIDYIPGDVNEDGVVNGKDVTLIRRYNAGHEVSINDAAADVNDDGVINGKDVTLIRRKNAGYEVELKPHTPRCSHTMENIAYKAATCLEEGNVTYYHCTTCDKYYSDSNCPVALIMQLSVNLLHWVNLIRVQPAPWCLTEITLSAVKSPMIVWCPLPAVRLRSSPKKSMNPCLPPALSHLIPMAVLWMLQRSWCITDRHMVNCRCRPVPLIALMAGTPLPMMERRLLKIHW